MPDAPDWYRFQLGSERHIIGDLGELAARLWSPMIYDRRGEVVWMDQFDYELNNWRLFLGGDGDAVSSDTVFPRLGKYCAKLVTTTAALRTAGIYAYVYPPARNKWGLEIAFTIGQAFDYFTIDMGYHDGTYAYRGYAVIDGGNDLLTLEDEDEGTVEVAETEVLYSLYGLYHVLKLVIDTGEGIYERILLDSNEYDVSDYTLKTVESSAAPCNGIRISFIGDGVGTDHARVGYVISTAHEP